MLVFEGGYDVMNNEVEHVACTQRQPWYPWLDGLRSCPTFRNAPFHPITARPTIPYPSSAHFQPPSLYPLESRPPATTSECNHASSAMICASCCPDALRATCMHGHVCAHVRGQNVHGFVLVCVLVSTRRLEHRLY